MTEGQLERNCFSWQLQDASRADGGMEPARHMGVRWLVAEQVPGGLSVTGTFPALPTLLSHCHGWCGKGRTCPRGQDFGLGHAPEVTHIPSAAAMLCSLSW